MKLAAGLDDDHGLVVDREVAFLRLLVGSADAASQRESLLREGDSGRGVHILFAGREGNWRNLMRAVQQQAGLVVTDSERGLEQGAAINFVPVDERIGFEVSLDNAERSGLRISSRMLAVARRVLPRS